MVSPKLREVLKRKDVTTDDLVREIMSISRGATFKELQDGFRVALGMGHLSYSRAQELLAAFKCSSGIPEAESDSAQIAALRQETRLLAQRLQQLVPEQKQIGALTARQKKLRQSLGELNEHLAKLLAERNQLETSLTWYLLPGHKMARLLADRDQLETVKGEKNK